MSALASQSAASALLCQTPPSPLPHRTSGRPLGLPLGCALAPPGPPGQASSHCPPSSALLQHKGAVGVGAAALQAGVLRKAGLCQGAAHPRHQRPACGARRGGGGRGSYYGF